MLSWGSMRFLHLKKSEDGQKNVQNRTNLILKLNSRLKNKNEHAFHCAPCKISISYKDQGVNLLLL